MENGNTGDDAIEGQVEVAIEAAADEMKTLVKAALGNERAVHLEHGTSVRTTLEVFATEQGCAVEELVFLREGDGDLVVLEVDVVFEADYPRHRRHHVHKRATVEVKVFYNHLEASHHFKRHATVEEVLDWALKLKTFGIDKACYPEFTLALHGSKEPLPGDEHIGHVAGHRHAVELDLLRGDMANG